MISSTHIITGAAIGVLVERSFGVAAFDGWGIGGLVFLVFALGALSHHLLDVVPHTDPGSYRKAGDNSQLTRWEQRFAWWDNILGTLVVLGIFVFVEPSWLMLVGSAGANFPDVWHHTPLWSQLTREKIMPSYFKFHQFFHWTATGKLILLGVLTNVFCIVVALFYILY